MVVFGGKSTEHDISVITGVLSLNALKVTGEEVLPLYITKEGRWLTAAWMNDVTAFQKEKNAEEVVLLPASDVLYIRKKNRLKPFGYVRAALCALHGKNGEDGSFAAWMKASRIPVASPDMTESAILMDKWYAKSCFSTCNIPVLPALSVLKEEFSENNEQAVANVERSFPYPLCVKPARLGSSIGISIVHDSEELARALVLVFRYDFRAVIEPALTGFSEYSVAVYQKEGAILSGNARKESVRGEILSFSDKYLSGGYTEGKTEEVADETISRKVEDLARSVYREMRLCGAVRFDFLEKDGEVYLNEANTVPGSLSYYFFADSPKEAGPYLRDLIAEGKARFREDESLKTDYISAALSGIDGKKYEK